MNKNIDVVRKSISLIAEILTNRDIKVTQSGADAYVQSDKKGKPVRINIPHIPDNVSDELLLAINGFLDHEVAHVLETDFRLVANAPFKNDVEYFFYNALEDARIETRMRKRFAGSGTNLSGVADFFIAKYVKPRLEKAIADGDQMQITSSLLMPALRAWYGDGQSAWSEFMSDKWHLIDDFAGKTKHLVPRMQAMSSTQDAITLGKEIYALITEPQQKPKPQPKQPEPEENQDEESQQEPNESQEESGDSGESKDSQEEGESSEEPTEESGESGASEKSEDSQEEESSPEDDVEGSDEPDDTDEDWGDDETDRSKELPDETDSEDEADSEEGRSDNEDTDESSNGDGDDEEGEQDDSDGQEGESEGESGSNESDEINSEDADEESTVDLTQDYSQITPPPDMAKSVSEVISEDMRDLFQNQEYRVFTTDYDRVEIYKSTNPKSDTSVDDKLKEIEDSVKSTAGPLKNTLQRLIKAKQQTRKLPGMKSGRVNASSLHRLKVGDTKVFAHKQMGVSKKVGVSLVVDCSGSMEGQKLFMAMCSAYVMSQTLTDLGIPNEVIGFTTKDASDEMSKDDFNRMYADYDLYSRVETLYMPIFKAFNEPFGLAQKRRMAEACLDWGFVQRNIDGESIRIAARRMKEACRGLGMQMIVLSDGNPAGNGNRVHLQEDLHRAINEITSNGIQLIGVGIEDVAVKRYYKNNTVIRDVGELPAFIIQDLKKLLL